ncbi:MAG TPA: hypothetical protein VGK15_02745 [Candidatus Limnocylindria bacterium]
MTVLRAVVVFRAMAFFGFLAVVFLRAVDFFFAALDVPALIPADAPIGVGAGGTDCAGCGAGQTDPGCCT